MSDTRDGRHELVGVLALLRTVSRRLPRQVADQEIWKIFDAALKQLDGVLNADRQAAVEITR